MDFETFFFGISWIVLMNAVAFSLGMLIEWNRKVGIFLTVSALLCMLIVLVVSVTYLAMVGVEDVELTIGFVLYMVLNMVGGVMTTPSWFFGRIFFLKTTEGK